MKFWDRFKKKPIPPEGNDYKRQEGNYEKPDQLENGNLDKKLSNVNNDAMQRLLEDEETRQRLQEELAASSKAEHNSLGQMLGKGIETLGGSLKKVSKGESLFDDEDHKLEDSKKNDSNKSNKNGVN